MDNFVDERDYGLLGKDKYTFSVLSRIIGGECALRLSDHKELIMCFTGQPYPVWIWTPDNASEEEMERAYQTAKDNSLMDGEHRFNLKYELAHYFIKRAQKDGLDLSVTTNLFAYDCPLPVPPVSVTDGQIHKCTEEDVDILVDFFDMFHNAVVIDKESREQYRIYAQDGVKNGSLYLWKTSQGDFASSCCWHPVQDMASIGLVYTREEYRRRHYAEHLVYQVTRITQEAGFLPMLYTDADYVASNACYEKIGYILRGRLCTIS
ncbi:MAG: GNAT family N-acetyltransferase [Clostridiales bacterium]|nr:GNAT family N-acetyltransferase [Clostridiales bacterium]